MDFAAIGDLLNPLLTASQTYGDALVPLGRRLLALSLVLAALPAVYGWWTGDVSGGVAKLLRAVLIFSIPFALLSGGNWTAATGSLAGFFQAEVTTPLAARGGAAGAAQGDLVKGLITKIGNGIWGGDLVGAAQSDKSWWEKGKSFFNNPVDALGGAVFGVLIDFLFRLILTAIAIFLAVAMLFALFSPLLMLQIGIIFGPILICWLPFSPLADLARTWLKFMITAGMSLAVGVLMVLLASTSIDSFISVMSTANADPDLPFSMAIGAKLGGFLSNAAVMIFIGVMLFKADNIAAALIGGATEGGGIGAVIMHKISQIKAPGGAGGKAK